MSAMWRSCAIWAVLALAGSTPAAAEPTTAVSAHGEAVDIGGRRLNLVCIGSGSPTVIFESELGATSSSWREVQPEVSRVTKACSYDRAGYGLSDPSRFPSDATHIVDDLHALLASARVGTPIVLVGHSMGGLYATLFADRYPREVAGLVLVDPSFAGQQSARIAASTPEERATGSKMLAGFIDHLSHCQQLAGAGSLSAANPSGCIPPPLLKSDVAEEQLTPYLKPAFYSALKSEFVSSDQEEPVGIDGREELAAKRDFGSKPLIVLTAGNDQAMPQMSAAAAEAFHRAWRGGHEALAARSKVGESIIVQGSGHNIQDEQPQVVAAAIKKVVDAARSHEAIR